MSGSSYKSGMLTNKGKKLSEEEVKNIMKLKIISLSIQTIPLIHQKKVHCCIKHFCKVIQLLSCCHCFFSVTPFHVAIELKLENNYTIIIEYGEYFSESTKRNDISSFASSTDELLSQNCREETIDLSYYYIDGDGVRLTILNTTIKEFLNKKLIEIYYLNKISPLIKNSSLLIMAYQHYLPVISFLKENEKSQKKYGLDLGINKKNPRLLNVDDFNIIECEIENKICLNELCKNFKGKNWKASNYNVVSHNCQHFAAEVIDIFKAKRKHDIDKLRSREKRIFPNCIIEKLNDNEEKESSLNKYGKYPIIGPIYDIYKYYHLKKNK